MKTIPTPDNLESPNIKCRVNYAMARKKAKGVEDEKLELEHDAAKEQLHQAELEEGYEQDEKFEESAD